MTNRLGLPTLRGFLGHGTFNYTTRRVPDKLGQVVNLRKSPLRKSKMKGAHTLQSLTLNNHMQGPGKALERKSLFNPGS